MPDRSLTQGDALPPLQKGKIRMYSMRYCPYAQRARIVMEHYKIPFETININLTKKPEWFAEKNPSGTVPVYEKDEIVLYESRVVSDYVDTVYGKGALYPSDPYLKAKASILIESTSKVTGPYYKLMFTPEGVKAKDEDIQPLFKGLQYYEDHLSNTFFQGSEVGMADYMLWPHIERFEAVGSMMQVDFLPKDKFPKLAAWVQAMTETPGVKATIFSKEAHIAFIKSAKNRAPLYDV